MLENIKSAALSMKNSALRTYRELNDTPLYMETYPGFFQMYQNETNHYPLTLLSNLQVGMFNPVDNIPSRSNLLPLHRGNNQYSKFNRGTRGVLHGDNISADYFPGFMDLIQSHNAVIQGPYRFDKTFIESVIATQATLARYLTDLKHFKSNFAVDGPKTVFSNAAAVLAFTDFTNVVDPDENIVNKLQNIGLEYEDCDYTGDSVHFKPFPIQMIKDDRKSYSSLIFITENTSYKSTKKVVNKHITKHYDKLKDLSKLSTDRSAARFLNLVDLDIMPVNVHALAREVPLINILNYAYSFDQMMIDLFRTEKIRASTNSLVAPTTLNLIGPLAIPFNIPEFIGPLPAGQETSEQRNLYLKSLSKLANNVRSEYSMVTTLANPYMIVDLLPIVPEWILGRIMVGGMGIEGFDRPKYLSDQIWNKTILHELNKVFQVRPDAAGPFANWYSSLSSTHSQQYNPAGVNPGNDRELVTDWGNKNLSYYKKGNKGQWSGTGANTDIVNVRLSNYSEGKISVDEVKRNEDGSIITSIERKNIRDLGMDRFNTKLVRNIVWITQLQRVVRWHMKQALRNRPHPLVYNADVARRENTEYTGNQMFDPAEYYEGPY